MPRQKTPSAKRIVVTGGAGFIGSHVVDGFIQNGHTVAVIDDLSTGLRRNINPAATFYNVNIGDASAIDAVFAKERPHVVNHHAAQASVTRSMRNPVEDAMVNIIGSLNLLEAARNYEVEQFIFASTGGALYGEPQFLPCDETHPVRPLSNYAAAKYAVEKYLNVYHESHRLMYTTLRYANAYGPRQNPYGEAGVIAIFAQRMKDGTNPVIYGTGEQERDFVYVGDIVQANIQALEQKAVGVYNIGSGHGVSVNHIVSVLRDILRYDGTVQHKDARLGEVFRVYLDSSLADIKLGWRPFTSIKDGLLRTVQHIKDTSSVDEPPL